jgi:hypothetical protein
MGVKGSEPMASKNDGYTSYGYIVTIGESPWCRASFGRVPTTECAAKS